MPKPRDPACWPRGRLRSRAWLGAAIALAALVPVAVWMWVSVETYGRALDTAQADQRRITETLRQYTLKLFEIHALVVDLVDREAGERDCAALRGDSSVQEIMAAAMRKPSRAGPVWVIDAQGYLCVTGDPAMMDARSRSFREYFIGARDIGAGRYYVDRAVVGVIDGMALFGIAKPRIKNGAFNGVILTSVGIADLMQAWHGMLGVDVRSQRVALFRADGATIARSWEPFVPEIDKAADDRVVASWGTRPEGSLVAASPVDGTPRVRAWRTLSDWGVVVASSVDKAEVLLAWRRSVLVYGVLAALASILVTALAWSLVRGQRMLVRTVEQRTRALRATEDRLSLFIDGAPAGIALFDRDMCYLAVSRRYLQDYGLQRFRPEEIVGLSYYEIFTDVSDRWRGVHRRALAGETLSADAELYSRADGSSEWLRWEMAPWRQPDGGLGGAVLFVELVTARKTAEEVLARDKEELERLVAERTRELGATQVRLAQAQRMEALGQLAGGIAHDFNNVIQAVQGGGALIERHAGDAERTRILAGMIIEAAGRGASITRRLLAFSRRSDLLAEPVDAGFLLAGLREILAHTIGAAIEVTMQVQAGLPPLLADKGQLETVLVNLATNARDAMPRGGRLILAAVSEVAQRFGEPGNPVTLQAGSYVCLSVSDSGDGMPPEVLARASEPFFTTKGVGQGTGLGLAMARGFAEQSGGGFHIASAPGQGTAVRLWMPVASAGAASPPAPVAAIVPSAVVPVGGPARLLIVDDDAIVRETLAQEMEAAGYAVLAAASGAEALTLLDGGEAVDIVVTDYSMPDMDGVTLIREARRRRPLLPAILLTGFTEKAAEIAIDGAITGAFTLLRKPIAGPVLAERAAVLLMAKHGPLETLPSG